jgi:hypothetical protein
MSAPDTETSQAPASAEQAADLAAIMASVNGAEVAAAPAGQVQEQQGPSAEAMGVAGLLVGIIKPIACVAIAGVKDAPDELWEPVAGGIAGLLDHYGLANEALSGPWAKFGFSIAPIAGFAAIAMINQPKKEALAKSEIYQVPGQMPTPLPPIDGAQE